MLKKVFDTYFRSNLPAVLIIALGLFFHFVLLGSFPVGLTHDDADVVGSIKTLAEGGVDVSGVKFPQLLFFNKTQGNISGLVSYLLSPIFKIVPLNLFSIHFVFVLINLFSIVILALIVYKLTSKYKLSIYVGLISLLNPWFFSYSRYPTEAPVALFFALVAILLFLIQKKYYLLFSSIFFSLSFYSYYGAKVAIPILFFALIFIDLFKNGFKKNNIKKYLIPILVFVSFVSLYFYISIFNPNSTFNKRMGGEFIFKNLTVYESQTNNFRNISIKLPLKNLFYNKYIFLTETVAKKYVGWMSPDILFFEGDPFAVYKFTDHGLLYVLDIILIISGIIYLGVNYKKLNSLIIIIGLMFLIGPIGSSISNVGISYYFRSFLLLPSLLILLGVGLYNLNSKIKLLFLGLYVLLFFRFLIFYFVRYPIYSQENNFLSERVVSSFINRELNGNKKVNLHISNIESFKNLNHIYNNTDLSRVNVTNDCSLTFDSDIQIFDNKLNCNVSKENYLVIQNQKDSGSTFKIFGGNLCNENNLTAYRREHRLDDYYVEKLNDQNFCNRWIQNGKTN